MIIMTHRYNIIAYVVFLISGVTTQTHVCDDVDTAACTEMSRLYPNLCHDPCTRDVCRKHCGLCPLTCYSCTGVKNIEDCHQKKLCTSLNQSCIVTQTVSPTFEIVYVLECVDNQVCEKLYHKAPLGKKRSIDLYGGCCDTDLCNKHVSSSNQIQNLTQATVSQNQQNTSNTIYGSSDLDQSICQKLVKTENDCKIPCNVKLCPQTCKQLTCYKCDYLSIDKIHLCNRTVQCSIGEECLISEVFDAAYRPGYTLGCASKLVCDRLHLHNDSLVDNVTTSTVTPNGVCCKTSLCNKNHTSVQTTSSPSPVVTQTVKVANTHHGLPCSTTPCKNGHCHNIDSSSYHCNCDLEWKGKNCDIHSACFSHPCLNNQVCHDVGETFKCTCQHGFTGPSCERKTRMVCADNNCNNGGKCHNVGNTSTCVCPAGYFGGQCEHHCHTHNTCRNGFFSIPGLENCYKFGHPSHYYTWEEARKKCNTMCSNLLVIENHHEESALSAYIHKNLVQHTHNWNQINVGSDFWIDARRLNVHSEFYWTSNGRHVTYSNWKYHHLNENCVSFGPSEGFDNTRLQEYYWNVHNCSRKLLSVCEYVPQ